MQLRSWVEHGPFIVCMHRTSGPVGEDEEGKKNLERDMDSAKASLKGMVFVMYSHM